MADLSQLAYGGTTYNLKDATARARNVPAGGTAGQVLAKRSATNYDTEWVDAGGGGADLSIIAEEYNTAAPVAYAVDDICTYNGNYYRCTAATSGAWDSSKWTQFTLTTVQTWGGNVPAGGYAKATNNHIWYNGTGQSTYFDPNVSPSVPGWADLGVASEYVVGGGYEVGDYCIYNDNFYKCIAATSGAWDSTKWTQVTVGGELKNAGGGSTVDLSMIAAEYSTSVTYNEGDYVIYNGVLYRHKSGPTEPAGAWNPNMWDVAVVTTDLKGKSTVAANDGGTAVEDLTEITIDGTTYSIPSGGGGSGSAVTQVIGGIYLDSPNVTPDPASDTQPAQTLSVYTGVALYLSQSNGANYGRAAVPAAVAFSATAFEYPNWDIAAIDPQVNDSIWIYAWIPNPGGGDWILYKCVYDVVSITNGVYALSRNGSPLVSRVAMPGLLQ